MYINIPRKHKCSKCGSIDKDIVYWKNVNQYRECTNCDHKVIVAAMTKTASGGIVYNMEDNNEPINF